MIWCHCLEMCWVDAAGDHLPSFPAQAHQGTQSKDGEHARHACLGQDAWVCDSFLPGDAQESYVGETHSTFALGESTKVRKSSTNHKANNRVEPLTEKCINSIPLVYCYYRLSVSLADLSVGVHVSAPPVLASACSAQNVGDSALLAWVSGRLSGHILQVRYSWSCVTKKGALEKGSTLSKPLNSLDHPVISLVYVLPSKWGILLGLCPRLCWA